MFPTVAQQLPGVNVRLNGRQLLQDFLDEMSTELVRQHLCAGVAQVLVRIILCEELALQSPRVLHAHLYTTKASPQPFTLNRRVLHAHLVV
jgi:hypothetical protein